MVATLEADLLFSAGMSGLTVAPRATPSDATAAANEQGEVGEGSGENSAPALEVFPKRDAGGCVNRSNAIRTRNETLEWANVGVVLATTLTGIFGFALEREFEVVRPLQRARPSTEACGGRVRLETDSNQSAKEGGQVRCSAAPRRVARLDAPSKIATTALRPGGVVNQELSDQYLVPSTGDPALRASPLGQGGGLRCGVMASAPLTKRINGFGAYLAPPPTESSAPSEFQISAHPLRHNGLLHMGWGQRCRNYSLGTQVNAEQVARVAEASLLIDEQVDRNCSTAPLGLGADSLGGDAARSERLWGQANISVTSTAKVEAKSKAPFAPSRIYRGRSQG